MNSQNKTITFFDTTLRDGEQSPGCSMTFEEKIQMARQLEMLQVDVIEAGFPIASEGDFKAVNEVAKIIKYSSVAGLCRASEKDIESAAQALKPAAKPRIHTFIATSDIHLKYKLNKTREQVLEQAVNAVAFAKKHFDDIEFSCEDAGRSDVNYLIQVTEAVIAAGATVVNIPDTVGYQIPVEFGALINKIVTGVSNMNKAILSVHCHNDLGLAVANSVAAIQNGARQVECTINGIGERAGNASLEELVMILKVRKDLLGFEHGLKTEEIYNSSCLLSKLTGMFVQRNKAIVGSNAFAHEAGIHQDGMIKNRITYEIMTPESVGIDRSDLVLGKHSGRNALKSRLKELGYEYNQEELNEIYAKFTKLADDKKLIYDEDLISIIPQNVDEGVSNIELKNLQAVSNHHGISTATIELEVDNVNKVDSATGNGPVAAAYCALERILGMGGALEDYTIHSNTHGRDAYGDVYVKINFNGTSFTGHATSTDIVQGSVDAYLQAANRAKVAQTKK